MSKFVKQALAFGGAPLLLGTGTFAVWAITGWNGWERAWFWLILFAIACILAGAVCLVREFQQCRTSSSGFRGLALAAGVLFLNFPLGAFYLWAAVAIATRYTVEVINDSGQPVQSIVVTGAGMSPVELGPLSAGATTQKTLRLQEDGRLDSLPAGRRGTPGRLDNSASPSCAEHKTVVVGTGGVWRLDLRASPRWTKADQATGPLQAAIFELDFFEPR